MRDSWQFLGIFVRKGGEEKGSDGFKRGKTSLHEGLVMRQLMDWQLLSKQKNALG